jgi:serine/threonine-protein kinase
LLYGEIARGGMGAVLKGRDPTLGRDLAVKVLLEAHRDNPELVGRFLEEAQIGGQLQHPGVVPVYELGRFDDHRPFFTMKLVKGQTLDALLKQRASPHESLPRFLTIFEQVCQTVAYAHARGVIHRDLKPSNVMVGAFGEVQVMDWGLAKVLPQDADNEKTTPSTGDTATVSRTARSASASDVSQAGMVMGTLGYMPPEQALGQVEALDERCDVFGLGAILCTILTNLPPYVASDALLLHCKAMDGDLTDCFSRLDGCGADGELVDLCKDCLRPVWEDRLRDAGVVAQRIAAYKVGVQQRLRNAELERAAAEVKAAEERKRRRLTAALALAVLALAVAGGGGAWGLARWRSHTDARINLALNEANALQAQAQAAPVGEQALVRWAEAEASARRLDDLLTQGFPSPEVRQRARDWIAELEGEAAAARRQAAAAERDSQFLDRLADIRTQKEDGFDQTDTDGAYAQAFRDYGLDVDALTTEVAARRVPARPWVPGLAAALDDWALERRRLRRPPAEWQRLIALARAADPDQWRDALRSLDYEHLNQERDRLLDLARTAKVSELPPASVQLLGQALRAAGEEECAAEVLRAALVESQRVPC